LVIRCDSPPCIVCHGDFVEDPGTVTELDPDVFTKDIFDDDAERTSQEYATRVEKFMSDMQPSDMLTVELMANDEATFYLTVDHYPAKLKLAFSITSTDATPIDMRVSLKIQAQS